ncbi:MAG: thiamine pyrophosphate-binding protein [Elusimicrobiota bacterium]
MIRVADYIIERLYDEGAKHIFMVTGRGILFLSDAVARHKEIKGISVHHEQAGAFAATAYAQCTDKIGACLVSTGCAGTNAITGLLCAWQDAIPCVFVSGQNKLQETTRYSGIPLRTFGQQEADIIGIVAPLTKYAIMITDPKRIAYELDKALYLAKTGRKGPVWIDVPLDIQNMRIEPAGLERFESMADPDPAPSAEDIEYVVKVLQNAERPVLLLGSGVRSADAIPELEKFVDKYRVPVTYAVSAPDVYGASNPLSVGTVGSIGGTRAGNFAVQNSDLLLVLGCRLSPVTTGPDYANFARAAKVVVVDIDRVEHSKKTVRIDRLVISDVKKFLVALMEKDIRGASEEWRNKCLHWKQVFPMCEDKCKQTEKVDLYYLAECLSETLSDGAVLLSDAGLEELIIPSAVRFRKGQRCVHPVSQGSMGYALPGAVGAYFACGRQTVAVIGDGSIMMNLQELQTIRYHNIPIKIFVVNNNAYAVIRERQVELFRTRTIGTDTANGVGCPNFKKVAECFEIPYIRIDDSTDLKLKILSVINMNGPVLCEVMGVENQDYIRSSYAHNSKRRVVQRPLEDQAPFMERELFLSEMIIESLD